MAFSNNGQSLEKLIFLSRICFREMVIKMLIAWSSKDVSIWITLKKKKKKKQVLLSPLLSQLPAVSSMHLILAEDSRKNYRAQTVCEPNALEQGSANDCLQAKSSPSFAFVNKVLVEHGHTPLIHLHMVYGCFHVPPAELNSYKRHYLAHKA